MNARLLSGFLFIALFIFLSCEQEVSEFQTVERSQLLSDIEFLASDELAGRFPGTDGSRMAQAHIEARFQALGLEPVGESYRHLFDHTNQRSGREFTDLVNIIGTIKGSENPDQFIAVIAHYDHLGEVNGDIFNGADDNASGTGGLLAAARYFSHHPPAHSVIFIALDAEEQGLGGARHFVEHPAIPLDQITVVVNMDMISHNFDNQIYAVGTYHYPFLKPFVENGSAGSDIEVLFGFDSNEWPQDWTFSSDHGPFHASGVPFIYFGVEDHPHYHQPTDTFDRINPDFYVSAVETIIGVIREFDANLGEIRELSGR